MKFRDQNEIYNILVNICNIYHHSRGLNIPRGKRGDVFKVQAYAASLIRLELISNYQNDL